MSAQFDFPRRFAGVRRATALLDTREFASASLRSFLFVLTNGATYCGLISRTSIPSD